MIFEALQIAGIVCMSLGSGVLLGVGLIYRSLRYDEGSALSYNPI